MKRDRIYIAHGITLRIKDKKEDHTQYAHQEVTSNGRCIGYIIKNKVIGGWNFISDKTQDLKHFWEQTKPKLLDKICSNLSNQNVENSKD